MEPAYDVLIAGAGLAGLAAAGGLLASCPCRLLLVDAPGSADRTLLTFTQVVADFNLRESVVRAYQAFSLHSSLGSRSLHRFAQPVLAAVDYRRLRHCLQGQLSGYDGWHRADCNVTQLRRSRDGWDVRLSSGDVVRASLVIDATGYAQFSARSPGYAHSPLYSHCYGAKLEGCQVDENDDVCCFLGGGAFGSGGGWYYPLGEGVSSFGCAHVTASPDYPAQRMRSGYERIEGNFQPYARLVAGARPVAVEMGSIPVGPAFPFVADGLMRVGDSAGQATAWMCMGVEPALVNGLECGRVAAAAWQRGDFRAANLRGYERAWRQANSRRYRQAMMLAPLQWVADDRRWDRAVANQTRYSSQEMLAKLRDNYPLWPLGTLYGFRLYDVLGRTRRRVAAWLGGQTADSWA